MNWQDVVIGLGQFVFGLALLPALNSIEKPPRSTCALTGSMLALFTFTYATLGLWWSAVSVGFCGALWLTLYLQPREAR